jgi:hypothetical protein
MWLTTGGLCFYEARSARRFGSTTTPAFALKSKEGYPGTVLRHELIRSRFYSLNYQKSNNAKKEDTSRKIAQKDEAVKQLRESIFPVLVQLGADYGKECCVC